MEELKVFDETLEYYYNRIQRSYNIVKNTEKNIQVKILEYFNLFETIREFPKYEKSLKSLIMDGMEKGNKILRTTLGDKWTTFQSFTEILEYLLQQEFDEKDPFLQLKDKILKNSKKTADMVLKVKEEMDDINKKIENELKQKMKEKARKLSVKKEEIEKFLNRTTPGEIKEIESHYIEMGKILAEVYFYCDPQKRSRFPFSLNMYRANEGYFKYSLRNTNTQGSTATIKIEEIVKPVYDVVSQITDLNTKVIKYGKITGNAEKTLKVLNQMDPEFPVFLPRLSELTELKQEDTEEALNFVLRKEPKLGKYDEMSQVLKFSQPDDIPNLIDNLLKEYSKNSEKKNRKKEIIEIFSKFSKKDKIL